MFGRIDEAELVVYFRCRRYVADVTLHELAKAAAAFVARLVVALVAIAARRRRDSRGFAAASERCELPRK